MTYVHLMFESHQVIWGNDLPSESFYPGPWGLSALDASALLEIAQLFPGALRLGADVGYGATARPVCRYADLRGSGLRLGRPAGPANRWLPLTATLNMPNTRADRLH